MNFRNKGSRISYFQKGGSNTFSLDTTRTEKNVVEEPISFDPYKHLTIEKDHFKRMKEFIMEYFEDTPNVNNINKFKLKSLDKIKKENKTLEKDLKEINKLINIYKINIKTKVKIDSDKSSFVIKNIKTFMQPTTEV